ncbi:MAG: lysophospholipid acyltransferase family protein [Anaerolineales bacterium]
MFAPILEIFSPPWSFAGLVGTLAVSQQRLISDRLYRILVRLLDILLWGGDLEGGENLPKEGPAVFIANHLDALGPIAIVSSLPMRVYPWIIADMVDEQKAAAYLNQDFTERQLHIPPPFSLWLSRLLARITVPLLRSFGCIPTYHDPQRLYWVLEESLRHLEQGHFLLIFPEDPAQPRDPLTQMTSLLQGLHPSRRDILSTSQKGAQVLPSGREWPLSYCSGRRTDCLQPVQRRGRGAHSPEALARRCCSLHVHRNAYTLPQTFPSLTSFQQQCLGDSHALKTPLYYSRRSLCPPGPARCAPFPGWTPDCL